MQGNKPKTSLCRLYLRGNCQLSMQKCEFAHGISDLQYPKYNGEAIEEDYMADIYFNQGPRVKQKSEASKNFITLYQYQLTEGYPHYQRFTQQEINTNRPKRMMVRNLLHRQAFEQFIELLQKMHPEANFSEAFVTRQYLRVGFNKLMTRIHISHWTNFLIEKGYFKFELTMPPQLKSRRTFYFKKTSDQNINNFYKEKIIAYCEQNQNINEENLKRHLISIHRNFHEIPPINDYLRQFKKSFNAFIEECIGSKVMTEADFIVEEISTFANQKIKDNGYVEMREIQEYLENVKKSKHSNLIVPWVQKQNKVLLKFQNFSMITTKQNIQQYEFKPLKCECTSFKYFDHNEKKQKKFEKEIIQKEQQKQNHLEKSVIVNSQESYEMHKQDLLNSEQLGIDLEGSLSKQGRVTMIQLNNTRKVYLIDYLTIQGSQNKELLQNVNQLMKKLMTDINIFKIFHYCKQDSVALHYLIGTCINNIFDTSATDNLISQLKIYNQNQYVFSKSKVLSKINNVKSIGLNEILKRYKAPNGINQHKDKFHKLFGKGDNSITDKRPLDDEFKEYCIKDVLDLPAVKDTMSKGLNKHLLNLLGSLYSNQNKNED